MKYLLFDISNVLFRTFHKAQPSDSVDTLAGLATHSALITLNKYYRMVKPDCVAMAMDRSSWRKVYTASDECISKKPYKGNRRKDQTPAQQAKYAAFMNHIREFESLIQDHTAIISLVEDDLEADDLIAGFCEKVLKDPANEVVLISTDTDMLQLLKYPNMKIISPATDKEQVLTEFDNDPLYYLFTKCVRGDPTDNIQSAYPGVRQTRIRKAYDDPYERVQLMNEKWTNENGTVMSVQALFDENVKLIDLSGQPEDIRELIAASVNVAVAKKRKFSMFHILKFVGKHDLVKIKESIDQYVPLLS